MLCQNCNKNEANVKYTQIVNGVKKQMILCDKCAKELGLDSQYFNMPIDFSSFLGDMFSDYTDSFIPSILEPKSIICKSKQDNINDIQQVREGEINGNTKPWYLF